MAKPLCCPGDLGPEPKIDSPFLADRALEALAWCNAVSDKVEATLNQKIAKEKTKSAESLKLTVDGVETTVDDYAAKLEAELQRWGLENREELFTEKKSVGYGHGGIALKGGSTSIVAIGDMDKLTARVWDEVKEELAKVLEGKGYTGFWRLKLEPDLAEIGRALRESRIKPGDLQRQGFKQSTAEPKVVVTTGVSTEKKK